MADCQYCLEIGNHYIDTELDPDNHVEVEVVVDEDSYLMVSGFHSNQFADWNIGVQIKYCPMCGRRLTGG